MRLLAGLLIMLLAGCATQRELSNAEALEAGGQLEEAYLAYSVLHARKPENPAIRGRYVNAAQGLLDQRITAAMLHYRAGALDQGDLERDRAQALIKSCAVQGISLRWDAMVDAARADARRAKSEAQYRDAEAAFLADRFQEAITLAQQCLQLERGHPQAPHLIRMAQAEPLYREALRTEELGLWRQAYLRYKEVAALDAAHKDVMARMDRCLAKSSYTLAYLPLRKGEASPNFLGLPFGSGPVDQELAALVQGELLALKDPYMQLIDRANTDAVMAEQRRQMSGTFGDQVVQAGKLLGARYILTGRVLKYDDILKRDLEVQVQLIDAETGRMLLSEVVRTSRSELLKGQGQKLTDLTARRIAERLRGFEPKG